MLIWIDHQSVTDCMPKQLHITRRKFGSRKTSTYSPINIAIVANPEIRQLRETFRQSYTYDCTHAVSYHDVARLLVRRYGVLNERLQNLFCLAASYLDQGRGMRSVQQYSFGSETKARHHISGLTEEKKAQPLSG